MSDTASTKDDWTHICNEDHATVRNQVKESLNFTVFLKKSPYVLAAGLILLMR